MVSHARVFLLLSFPSPTKKRKMSISNNWITSLRGQICKLAQWPMRLELIAASSTIKGLGLFLLPPGWDASPLQGYQYPVIHSSKERHCESHTTQSPWPRLEPGPLDPETNALPMRPPQLAHSVVYQTFQFVCKNVN